MTVPTLIQQREWLRQWQTAKAGLRAIKAAELSTLTEGAARQATGDLLDLASRIPVAAGIVETSGLIEQQRILTRHAKRTTGQ
jgi:hypothetical protein